MPGPPPEHGTRSKYVTGCRCPQCTRANRAYHDSRRPQRPPNTTKTDWATLNCTPRDLYYGYDLESLHQAVPETRNWNNFQWAKFLDVSHQSWARIERKGALGIDQADRIATKLGIHPVCIWPRFHHKIPGLDEPHAQECHTQSAHSDHQRKAS